MRHSLLWRIAVPYSILLIVALGGIYLYLSGNLRSSVMEQTGAGLLGNARLIREELLPIVQANPKDPRINDLAQRFAAATQKRVTIILPDGVVVGESDAPLNTLENHLNRPEVQGALQKNEQIDIRYSATLKSDLMYAAVPLLVKDQVAMIVRVAYPLASIQNDLNRNLNSILLAAGITAVLVILLAFLITRYTLVPLRSLQNAVTQITHGVMPDIIESRRKDEISQLQSGFRSMSQQINEQFEDLQAERSKLEAVLMNMTDGIIIVDAQGRVNLINPAGQRMFDVQTTQPLDKTLVEVVRQHQIVEFWRRCKMNEIQQSASFEVGAERLFVQAFATLLGPEMEGAVLMVFQNLTRVRRLETVRRDFISNISHELRTPLASLKALTETLQEGALEDPPAARRFLKQMEVEIDNLTQMVQEVLELSRIESGKVPLELKAIDPCEFLTLSVERMKLQAERAGLTLRLDCSQELPAVRADSGRILQVLVNLIHNAVKFTQPGGEIIVSAFPRENEVVFTVKDTGVGIPVDDLTRIFERFYKADRSRSGGGTGLGLSIARHMVESHGGRIWVESEQNIGSTFYFTLPTA
jgi:two-component system, OmpR family, phosphate regulon sensor histidine kinase PhoR